MGKLVAIVGLLAMVGAIARVTAQRMISRDEALQLTFPGAAITSSTVFLTEAQQARAAKLAGEALPSPLIARYVARVDGRIIGRAYVDTHVVRRKRESLLISLDSRGRVKRIDATAFLEPPEYQAPDRWLEQYDNRALGPELSLQRSIRGITGATLTAMATNAAVRRVLALDQVLEAAADQR
ncbi:MAG: FMN-binding protein [Luteitalea sp.]|nr:FMN-binding protein [Luteitalea sp.]